MEQSKIFLLIRNPFAKGAEDLQLSINSNATILEVKNEVTQQHMEKPPIGRQKLICAGKILADSQKLDEIFKDKDITAPQVIHLVINRGPAVEVGATTEDKKSSPTLRSSAPSLSTSPSTLTYRPLSASQPVNPRMQYPSTPQPQQPQQPQSQNQNFNAEFQQQQQQLAQFYLQQMQRQYAQQQQQQQQQQNVNVNNNQQAPLAPVACQLHIHLNFGTVLKGLFILYLLSLRETNASTLFVYAVIGFAFYWLQSLLVGQPGGAQPLQFSNQPQGIIGELLNFFMPLVLSLFPSWKVDHYYSVANVEQPNPNPQQNNNNNHNQPQQQQQPNAAVPQLHPVENNNMDVQQPL